MMSGGFTVGCGGVGVGFGFGGFGFGGTLADGTGGTLADGTGGALTEGGVAIVGSGFGGHFASCFQSFVG